MTNNVFIFFVNFHFPSIKRCVLVESQFHFTFNGMEDFFQQYIGSIALVLKTISHEPHNSNQLHHLNNLSNKLA